MDMMSRKKLTTIHEVSKNEQSTSWVDQGAGAIIVCKDTNRILLPLRSEWVLEPNTWGTWGGAVDRDEAPVEAAIRELEEETGYDGKIIDTSLIYTYDSGDFKYHTFAVVVPKEFEPELNWETEEAKWVDFGKWPTPLHFGLEEVLKNAKALNKLGMLVSD